MRSRRPLLAVTAMCGIVAGCATPRSQAGAADSGTSLAADTIPVVMLERSACRGFCPAYVLQVFTDGRVHFTGIRSVTPIGTDTARITTGDLAALRTAFADRGFAAIPAVIEQDGKGCGSYATDLPTVTLAVHGAGGVHRVRYDEGCRDHPAMLDTLARLVDERTGSRRWTTSPRP